MRSAIAAACAALLVGLAPPAAFACACLRDARPSAASSAAAAYRVSVERVEGVKRAASVRPVARAAARSSLPSLDVHGSAPWRSPSGPAPAQAPPSPA